MSFPSSQGYIVVQDKEVDFRYYGEYDMDMISMAREDYTSRCVQKHAREVTMYRILLDGQFQLMEKWINTNPNNNTNPNSTTIEEKLSVLQASVDQVLSELRINTNK